MNEKIVTPQRVKWEYKVTEFTEPYEEQMTEQSFLTQHGLLGWELVQVVDYDVAPKRYYFKREVHY